MGSCGDDPNKGIDSSVGGLVWVRRRNGSWWPGRIVGPDELPDGCVPTPRAGTPVKLLGREDASVDWYNLEKSKRVKPFRCGEYDDCIEKAKESVSHVSKKAVKYARREEAILHALQLESARLGKDCPDFSTRPDPQEDRQHHLDEPPSSVHPTELSEDTIADLRCLKDNSESALELSCSGASFEEPKHLDTVQEESKRRTLNNPEDDGTEGVKRMRGLEDLGMGVASSPKGKRSPVARVNELLKRKNRRRTLTKVLECTETIPGPVVLEQLPSMTGFHVPGASESKESNESKINNYSDSTGISSENPLSLTTSRHAGDASVQFVPKENEISDVLGVPENESSDVPLLGDEKNSSGLSIPASQKAQVGARIPSSQSNHVETLSLGTEEHKESGSASSGNADFHKINQRIEKGASEWQLKGKRNARSRKMDVDDEAETNTASLDCEKLLLGSRRHLDSNQVGGQGPVIADGRVQSRPITDILGEEFHGWNWTANHTRGSMAEMATPPHRLLQYQHSRLAVNQKYDLSDFSNTRRTDGSGLYDVALEVETSHRPQHVPYISLMGKIYGRPVIGHPITIEALDNGFCDELLSLSECHSSNSERMPAYAGIHASCNPRLGRRPPGKRRRLQGRKSWTKSTKLKRNTLLSKKIRTLSSLTGAHGRGQDIFKPGVEKLNGPIPCVPLNVVFSRINAALNCSMRPPPRLAAVGGA